MPLVHIHVIRGRNEQQTRTLLDSIHDSTVVAFDVPASDRYQILTQHDPHEIIALDTGQSMTRTNSLVMLHFVSRERTEQAKQRLYELLAANLHRNCGVSSEDLVVTITENGAADWSFGRGVAQFVTGEL